MTNGTWLKVFAFVSLIVLIGGCAQTQQMRKTVKTGFLGKDYALLQEGKKGEALLVYKNPKANWASYDKVIVDPVTIWKDKGTKDVSPEDLQRLANDFWSKIRQALGSDYEIVYAPGPGVIRVRVAITEAEASDPVMDTITSIIPQTRLLTGIKGIVAGGKPGFVGAASVEAKVTDAQTGMLLAAAVDRRAGTKSIRGSTDEWGDVDAAYQYWADKFRWRLCQLRGGTNCIKPKT